MDYIYMVTGDVLIVSLAADLDHHLAAELREVIDNIIDERRVHKVVFDFEKVTFMDSSGIGLIMGRYKKLGKPDKLVITGAGPAVRRILEISGLHKLVTLSESVNDAVKHLQEV